MKSETRVRSRTTGLVANCNNVGYRSLLRADPYMLGLVRYLDHPAMGLIGCQYWPTTGARNTAVLS